MGNNDFWVVKLKDKDKKIKEERTIEAFPNPAQQYTNVIVGFDYTKGNVSVYDISGRQLQDFKATDRTIPVDLNKYPEGIYIIKVATDKGDASMKIIKSISK
ncbi:T9SS type A sorting domain-containing protein [Flavobacterium sp. 3HN19-14]|uniref:T9SS type A sorting domain-containing protein n=1 Tax=Flavobacterium sp. 3HN19-14 TaxID=3448133 RepID=UPI003EDF0CB8